MTTTEGSKELTRFLRGLRAVRDYTPEPVSDDVLNDILEVGRRAGSASNRQPTEVVVVRDPAVNQAIADGGVHAAATAPVSILVLTPSDSTRTEIEAFDNGRLVERLLLAAHAHGLGANIGTLKDSGPAVVSEALGIPASLRPWTVVTLGHIDHEARKVRPKPATTGRKPLEQFAHWDRYEPTGRSGDERRPVPRPVQPGREATAGDRRLVVQQAQLVPESRRTRDEAGDVREP